MTWVDSRNDSCGMYGTVIGADGSLTPADGSAYVTQPCQYSLYATPTFPALASHHDGKALLAYERIDRIDRVRGVIVGTIPSARADLHR